MEELVHATHAVLALCHAHSCTPSAQASACSGSRCDNGWWQLNATLVEAERELTAFEVQAGVMLVCAHCALHPREASPAEAILWGLARSLDSYYTSHSALLAAFLTLPPSVGAVYV